MSLYPLFSCSLNFFSSSPCLSFFASSSLRYQSYMEDHLKNKDRLDREWKGLLAYEADTCFTIAGQLAQNTKKNRYPDILPYDHSRVILNDSCNSSKSDYINASTIVSIFILIYKLKLLLFFSSSLSPLLFLFTCHTVQLAFLLYPAVCSASSFTSTRPGRHRDSHRKGKKERERETEQSNNSTRWTIRSRAIEFSALALLLPSFLLNSQ